MNRLRRALHTVCETDAAGVSLWSQMTPSSADEDTKNKIVATVARDLEFSVVSMCTSLERYKEQGRSLLKAVRELPNPGIWAGKAHSDVDEVQEVVDTMKRVSKSYRQKTTCKTRT